MSRAAGFRHTYRPVNPYRHPSGMLRVVVYLDDETLAEIDAEAQRDNCTISSTASKLIEVGIETIKIEREAAQP